MFGIEERTYMAYLQSFSRLFPAADHQFRSTLFHPCLYSSIKMLIHILAADAIQRQVFMTFGDMHDRSPGQIRAYEPNKFGFMDFIDIYDAEDHETKT